MQKIVVILLCIWTMVLLTGCNSDATKELNPFEQTSLNKTGKYEVLSQEGYITPTCYVYMDDLAMGLYERSFMEDDIFISGVSVTNEGVDPINISDTLRISVTQSGSELEIVPEYYSPSDIQLQPQETTIITEYYYLKNRRAHIDIEVISLDKTSPVIVSTYYEVYRGSASIVPYNELQNSNGNTTPLFFTRIQNIYNEPNMNCFIELPNEWLDAIALEEEESYGSSGIITNFYSRHELDLGGEGFLFAIGVFDMEYDYSCKPWFNQSKQLGTYTNDNDQVYTFVQILPDPEMEIKDPTAYDALNSKTKAVIDSLYLESEY